MIKNFKTCEITRMRDSGERFKMNEPNHQPNMILRLDMII